MDFKSFLSLFFLFLYISFTSCSYAQHRNKRYFITKKSIRRHKRSVTKKIENLFLTNSTVYFSAGVYNQAEENAGINHAQSFAIGSDYRFIQYGLNAFNCSLDLKKSGLTLPVKIQSIATYIAVRLGKPALVNETEYYLLAGPAIIYASVDPQGLTSHTGTSIGTLFGAGYVYYWQRFGIGIQLYWIEAETKTQDKALDYHTGSRQLNLIFKWLL